MVHADFEHTLAVERRRSGQQKVADSRHRIQITATIDALWIFDRLGRHVERRADNGADGSQRGLFLGINSLYQSEIQNFDDIIFSAAAAQHYIRRLDIAVDETD